MNELEELKAQAAERRERWRNSEPGEPDEVPAWQCRRHLQQAEADLDRAIALAEFQSEQTVYWMDLWSKQTDALREARALAAELDLIVGSSERTQDILTGQRDKAIAAALALRDALHGTGPNDHQVLMDTAWLEEHR